MKQKVNNEDTVDFYGRLRESNGTSALEPASPLSVLHEYLHKHNNNNND